MATACSHRQGFPADRNHDRHRRQRLVDPGDQPDRHDDQRRRAWPAVVGQVGAVDYTAFDSYQRNFLVNLSSLITTSSNSPNAQIVGTPPVNTAAVNSNGGHFMLIGVAPVSFAEGVFGDRGTSDQYNGFIGRHAPDPAYIAFAGADGSFWAVGRGVSSSLAFAQATWGADNLAAEQTGDLGVAGALVNLAQGGYSATIGGETLGHFRIAASWTSSPAPVGSAEASDRNRSDATAAALASPPRSPVAGRLARRSPASRKTTPSSARPTMARARSRWAHSTRAGPRRQLRPRPRRRPRAAG